ncbi:MAG: ATP-binding protein [Saprospiraceae bacterium]
MPKPYSHIILILFILCSGSSLAAQDYLFDTQMLTTENGLANLMTSTIYKNQRGIIWMGTKYGLNSYDGHEFKLYTKEKNGLSSNRDIVRISEDDKGRLWLFHGMDLFLYPHEKTMYDISIFDPKTERSIPFITLFKDQAPFAPEAVLSLRGNDPENRLWLSTKEGQLFRYEAGQLKKIFEKAGSVFQYFAVEENGEIWLAGRKELIKISASGKYLKTITLSEKIGGLWIDQEKIWGTTVEVDPLKGAKEKHIFSITKETEEYLPFQLKKRPNASTEAEAAIVLERCPSNQFWYANIGGELNIYSTDGDWLYSYEDPFYQRFIRGFNDFFVEDDLLWVATEMGVIKTRIKKNPFTLIHQSKSYSDTRGIAEDEQGKIYFLQRETYCWNPQETTLAQVTKRKGAMCLIYHDSTLWSGCYSEKFLGFQLDLKTGEDFVYKGAQQEIYATTALQSALPGQYIVGVSKGIAVIDLTTHTVLPYNPSALNTGLGRKLQSTRVWYLHENTQGLWVTTENGIFLLKKGAEVLQHFCKENGHLPFDRITHLHEDETGVFWLATQGGGAIRWEPARSAQDTSIYEQITTQEGLSNDYIYAIYGDENENLWMSSDFGLMQMDRNSLQVKTYFKADGLPHDEFNSTAHYKAKDGTLYFGGLGGLISFDPSSLGKEEKNETPLEFTGYYLLEADQAEMSDQTHLLYEAVNLKIQPTDKLLELHFTLLDYEIPKNHRYAYKIEGYTDYWVHTKENYVSITNLPYGNYTLKIKGKRYNSEWATKELSLGITVLQPFYYHKGFLLAILLSLLSLGFLLFKWRLNSVEKDRATLELEVQNRTRQIKLDKQLIAEQAEALRKADEAKTRFFSNITHEFRTPLTLIMGPVEQLLQQDFSKKVQQQLSIVLKNSRHLLSLINQLLDLSKLESKQMAVELTYGDLLGYTQELTTNFQTLAEQKEISLNFITDQENWQTYFDLDKWNKIVYNLLSNAMKFTPQGGQVDLSLTKENRGTAAWIKLMVKDTGIGVEKMAQQQIFDRFYQADASSTRTKDGTGIGLALVKELIELQGGKIKVESSPQRGTTFEVTLPVPSQTSSDALPAQFDLAPQTSFLPEIKIAEKEKPVGSSLKDALQLLLIEDNVELQAYIQSCIDPTIYEVTTAQDGEEGLEKALAIIPDLIICDVMMPKKNGFEVVAAIRNQLCTSHIPIILLTAKTSLESRLAGIKHGADAYLTKPFNSTELILRIQKLIETRKALQQRYSQVTTDSQLTEQVAPATFLKEDQFIKDLHSFVKAHLQSPNLNGDLIGKHFNISRMQLHRKLKSLTNTTISEIIRDTRLTTALDLLQKGEANVSEVSYQTGFSSPAHFSRTFKKKYGKPPSEA